nr:hypothetical protein [Tanacetum cinerariifolium]
MQRAKVKSNVVIYALLISAYGKGRKEEEAMAVFEEMLDAGVRMMNATMLSTQLLIRLSSNNMNDIEDVINTVLKEY